MIVHFSTAPESCSYGQTPHWHTLRTITALAFSIKHQMREQKGEHKTTLSRSAIFVSAIGYWRESCCRHSTTWPYQLNENVSPVQLKLLFSFTKRWLWPMSWQKIRLCWHKKQTCCCESVSLIFHVITGAPDDIQCSQRSWTTVKTQGNGARWSCEWCVLAKKKRENISDCEAKPHASFLLYSIRLNMAVTAQGWIIIVQFHQNQAMNKRLCADMVSEHYMT